MSRTSAPATAAMTLTPVNARAPSLTSRAPLVVTTKGSPPPIVPFSSPPPPVPPVLTVEVGVEAGGVVVVLVLEVELVGGAVVLVVDVVDVVLVGGAVVVDVVLVGGVVVVGEGVPPEPVPEASVRFTTDSTGRTVPSNFTVASFEYTDRPGSVTVALTRTSAYSPAGTADHVTTRRSGAQETAAGTVASS